MQKKGSALIELHFGNTDFCDALMQLCASKNDMHLSAFTKCSWYILSVFLAVYGICTLYGVSNRVCFTITTSLPLPTKTPTEFVALKFNCFEVLYSEDFTKL